MLEAHNRILVVDDDSSITEFVGYALSKEGYTADIVDNGEEALELSVNRSYDLFILDIMLPGMDGYELCRRLRGETSAPVLFLSARDTELDKVVGLEIGGDDYLAKPFGVRELIARVRALLRRGHGDMSATTNAITAAGITLDEDAHTAKGDAGEMELTPREFELLAALMKNAGKVVSRDELLHDAWGWEYLTRNQNGRHPRQASSRQDIPGRLRSRRRGNGARLRIPVQGVARANSPRANEPPPSRHARKRPQRESSPRPP